MKFSSEVDLAEIVVAKFREDAYSVYQEVDTGHGIIDIVAVRENLVDTIECKLNLGFDVLAQAEYWIGRASTHSWVAVSWARRSDARSLAEKTAKWLGIGILEVSEYGVQTVVEPRRTNMTLDSSILKKYLNERQRDYAKAGNSDGKRFTKFTETTENVLNFVRAHPGCTLDEIADNVKHHYSSKASLKQCLVKYITPRTYHGYVNRPVIEGLRLEPNGRSWRVFVNE